MRRTAAFYTAIVLAPILLILVVLRIGQGLEAPDSASIVAAATHVDDSPETGLAAQVMGNLAGNGSSPLARLVLQMLVIIVAARVLGWVFVRLGQPAVIGEIVAGVLLGPSLFGAVAPHAFATLSHPNPWGL